MVFLFTAISCNKNSDNPTQSEPFTGNLSGIWIAEETINGSSQSGSFPQTRVEIFKISQSGNTLKIIMDDDTTQGEITGNTIKWKGTRLQNNVSVSIDFSAQISSDGKTFSGTGTWTAQSGGYSENGTITISAWISQKRNLKLSGQWEGTYSSFDGNGNGSFSVNLIQMDSLLAGTIKIPSLGIDGEEISGKIVDNCWSFGDINNRIKFIGIMDKDSLHYKGSYAYLSNDEGKWSAAKVSDSTARMLMVVKSFPITADYNSDLAYDGNYLWLYNDRKIRKYSTNGQLIDSLYTPGNYPVGLTCNGTSLVSADGEWGVNKIYFLSPDGSDVYKTPAGYFSGLALIGNDIWYLDQDGKKIIKSSKSGKVLQEISVDKPSTSSFAGLVYADNHLWYSAFDQSAGKMRIYKIDLNGNAVSSFLTDGFFSGGLSYDGTNLLFVSSSENKIYKYDLNGNLASEKDINLQRPSQIAYDGSNIWLLAAKDISSWQSGIYKLNSSYQVIDSVSLPGQNTSCFTWANNYIWVADQSSGKILRVNPNNGNYFTNPVTDLGYLCYGDSKIWGLDNMGGRIYNFSTSGNNVTSFSSPVENTRGIAIDGNVLWILFRNSNYKTALCKATIYGEKVEEFTTSFSEPTGLVFDGEYFWAIGQLTSFDPQRYLFKLKVK